ncbi:crotonase/enoyl-CoA hydratase family protein [Legionella drancourtii]|uniref:crotonase/enoyl-CoA hydratase family protein n=1 Tax=Legionella drancourtii TaxID=168933 RepID=UPI0001B02225|nr:crotonase/enoyl-CoA hydratase family protein [Legionella drancourtii]
MQVEIDKLPLSSDLSVTVEKNTVFARMNSQPRPCFTSILLENLATLHEHMFHRLEREPLYFILCSDIPNTFNLGGDLDYFYHCIMERDSDLLLRYGVQCIDLIHQNLIAFRHNVVPIALVEGDALGGGFECALSCDVIIAEEQSMFGTPEIKFNLFPGMGAFHLLKEKTNLAITREILTSGHIFTAQEMLQRGIVDYVVPKGEGKAFLEQLIHKHMRSFHGLHAIREIEHINSRYSYDDLLVAVNIWVNKALSIDQMSLGLIRKLVHAQSVKYADDV